jgi:hypothetical protein
MEMIKAGIHIFCGRYSPINQTSGTGMDKFLLKLLKIRTVLVPPDIETISPHNVK